MDAIFLGDSAAEVQSIAGNKAAALARLMGRGFNIPPGVVVTGWTNNVNGDITEVEETLRRFDVSPPWAVRSSSNAEDGSRSAFPGIFRTVLGVASGEQLADAIASVDTSLTSDGARRYASARGLEHGTFSMSILIQSQLSPSVAGVAFSRDPVTGADHVGIEANYGLGESVVDGSATPDYFEVPRDRRIANREIGTKTVEVVMGANGVERRAVPQERRAQPAINDEDVLNVADLVWRLENELGGPQDVEWAIEDAVLFLLQTRPITTGDESQ